MSFQFINNADIDRKARKLIRSHAATGKNAGKTRPRRKQSQQAVNSAAPIWFSRPVEAVEDPSAGPDAQAEVVPTIERQLGDGLSVTSLPAELTPASKTHLKNAFAFLSQPKYPPEISHLFNFTGFARTMIKFIILDEAFLHSTIATSVAATNRRLLTQDDAIESMYHLSCTFRLVGEKLSGDKALADTTMAAILAMSRYERLQGRYAQGLVHFKGLMQLVELRGGIAQLQKDRPGIAQKVFSADLEFATQLGSATNFDADVLPGHDTISWFRSRIIQESTPQFFHSPLCRELSIDLQDVLVDITGLASWLPTAAPKKELKWMGIRITML